MSRLLLPVLGFLLTTQVIAQTPKSPTYYPSEHSSQIKRLVLQIEIPSSAMSAPIDSKAIEKEIRDWLTSAGLEVVEYGTSEPDKTYHLKLGIQAFRTRDGIYIYDIFGRCSLLSNVKLNSNEPGKEQKVWFSNYVSGQKSDNSFKDSLITAVHSTLKDMSVLYSLHPAQEDRSKSLQASEGQDANVGDKRKTIPEFQFSQIKVRKQPQAPPYPASARSKNIQGTVIIEILIDASGMPIRVDALSGPPELLITAIRYALRWEFEPACINGIPVSGRFRLTIPFILHEDLIPAMPPR